MSARIQKWGNSLGVRIPKALAEQVQLKDGAPVKIDAAGGVLTIRAVRVRKRKRKHTLAALLSKAKGPSPHRNLDRDDRIGRELL